MSIGKVSKQKNVSIKSLRYYDQIGILKPAFVNTETNYRYYTPDQLYLLDAITVCIKLGIPLKDLNRYVEHDSINLQKLLYDGKILAEQKILDIHNCLGTLQETLQNMGSSVTGMAKIPGSKSGILLPDGFYHSNVTARTVLTVPLDEVDTPKYYGQHILRLFVTAQQLNLSASYPSGVLHEYIDGQYHRYMFLTVANAAVEQNAKADPSSDLSSEHNSAPANGIRKLAGGSYACRRISTHMSDFNSVKDEMKEVLKGENFCIIETDTLSDENKKDGYPFELEYYISR